MSVAARRGVDVVHDEAGPPRRQIVLIRHGRSAHGPTGWIDAAGLRAWREAYERAGIREDESVPSALRAIVESADLVLASDAPRAVVSARLLAPGREVVLSPRLRELELPGPELGAVRLPLIGWAVAIGLRMRGMAWRGRFPSAVEVERVRDAAAWLDELAERHDRMVVVTHASFRVELARDLERAGWGHEPGRRGSRPWSAWVLSRRRLR